MLIFTDAYFGKSKFANCKISREELLRCLEVFSPVFFYVFLHMSEEVSGLVTTLHHVLSCYTVIIFLEYMVLGKSKEKSAIPISSVLPNK